MEPVSGNAPPAAVRPIQFVWAYPPEPPFRTRITPLRHAPAVDAAGRMYLHLHGRLVALTEEEGRAVVAWEYVTGSHAPGPVVLGEDGVLRVHTVDARLHLVATDGKQVAPPAAAGEPLGCAAPLVDRAGNTYLSAYDGGLLRVASGGGKPTLYFRSRLRLDCPALLHDDTLFIGAEDGHVFAITLGAARGENRWNAAQGQGVTGWFVNVGLRWAGDTLVVASGDEHLYGFDVLGHLQWRVRMPGAITGAPVIDGQGHLYAGITQAQRGQKPRGLLVSIDGNAQQIRWEYPAAAVESTPVVDARGTVYFGDNAGTIHAVDGHGAAVWTARVEAAVRSTGALIAPRRLAWGLDNETLVVLEI